jgi:hypothetical protein
VTTEELCRLTDLQLHDLLLEVGNDPHHFSRRERAQIVAEGLARIERKLQ